MTFLQAISGLALLVLLIFAIGGAVDYIVNSVQIFRAALKRRRERNGNRH